MIWKPFRWIGRAILTPFYLVIVVPFFSGADRARRRRLRMRISRLRTALREGREGDVDAQLRRVVALRGADDPFLREWFRRPSYLFRPRLLPVVGAAALCEVMGRRDDPLAPRAWLAYLRKEGRPTPTLEDVADEELRRLWERQRAAGGFPGPGPLELLTSRPPA